MTVNEYGITSIQPASQPVYTQPFQHHSNESYIPPRLTESSILLPIHIYPLRYPSEITAKGFTYHQNLAASPSCYLYINNHIPQQSYPSINPLHRPQRPHIYHPCLFLTYLHPPTRIYRTQPPTSQHLPPRRINAYDSPCSHCRRGGCALRHTLQVFVNRRRYLTA